MSRKPDIWAKTLAKRVLDGIGIDAKARDKIRMFLRLKEKPLDFVPNVNHTNYNKKCLFIYITRPFYIRKVTDSPQNQGRAIDMARIIGSYGYNVDMLQTSKLLPKKYQKTKYDFIIGLIPRGIDYWTGHMNEGCIRVAFMTSMNLAVTNGNEKERLHDLEKRRGRMLSPRMSQAVLTKDLEDFNAAWYIGNSYNVHSYDSFNMPPIYYILNNGYNFSWLNKDIVRDKRSFIFFNSRGMVHKGLDLLLEIFGREGYPYNLYICAGFNGEEDFCEVYHEELFNRPNIFPIGWIDVYSDQFRELTEKCAYMLLPSCAEGRAGSALTMMSAGVIPITSKVCGFEDDEVIHLPDCRIETIERYIEEYANKPDDWIRERSAWSVEVATTRYSKEKFRQSVHDAMTSTLKGAGLI